MDLETSVSSRLVLHHLRSDGSSFGDDVRKGLGGSPKTLSPKYFYDELGSHLFEAICLLPEYYLTRAEHEILQRDGDAMLAGGPRRMIELGSGRSTKTRLLIEASLRRSAELEYLPIDISAAALEETSHSLLKRYPRLEIRAYAAEYGDALDLVAEQLGPDLSPVPTLAVFLGSSIGNFDPPAATDLLRHIQRVLRPGDALLLGTDMLKAPEVLLPAYDDALGVTAAFNLNLLNRINRELGGDFDLSAFRHEARFNRDRSRVELHAVSRRRQRVALDALAMVVDFEEEESIHTESSYKFSDEDTRRLAEAAGFRLAGSFKDARGYFALNLLSVSKEST